MKSQTEIPRTPSALIRLALEDLKACKADPRYRIDRAIYHHPQLKLGVRKCTVCFAGAVMAQTLGASPDQATAPSAFPLESGYLIALSYFAFGQVWSGLTILARHGILREDQACGTKIRDRDVPEPAEEFASFISAMETLASELEKEGL